MSFFLGFEGKFKEKAKKEEERVIKKKMIKKWRWGEYIRREMKKIRKKTRREEKKE